MALTVKRVERLKTLGLHLDGRRGGGVAGLYLQIRSANARSWVLRYERDGRERWMGLGPVSEVTLEQARELALAARAQLRQGVDPITSRRETKAARRLEAAASARSFSDAADLYFNHHSAQWGNDKYKSQFHSSLRAYAYPVIGDLPISAVDRTLVLQVLQPIWQSKTKTASRVRRRIEAVLDFAKVQGWRTGENPAAWTGNLKHALPAVDKIASVKHHAALPWSEVPHWSWRSSRQQEPGK